MAHITTSIMQTITSLLLNSDPNADINISTPIQLMNVPKQEQGYKNFDTTRISTEGEFYRFLCEVKAQSDWNHKEDFFQSIQSEVIDFSHSRLLLYRVTEPSISIAVTPQEPIVDGHIATIPISEYAPQDVALPAVMAYYTFAYKVDRNITQINFLLHDTNTTIRLENLFCTAEYAPFCSAVYTHNDALSCEQVPATRTSCDPHGHDGTYLFDGQCPADTPIPDTCIEWFDGCNNCSKDDNGYINCTEAFCALPIGPFECYTYAN